MLYHIVFQVSTDNSGKATYYAKRIGGVSHPYQKPIGNNRCEQEFYYSEIDQVNKFIKDAFEDFGTDFVIISLCLENKEGA
ncbi:MAG: hypothetical protein IKI57_01830 [Clostridia bacterium]|nr:hypothetical protein [Clostridia bacterium]